MYHVGIDIGSTYTKYCVMDRNNKIISLYAEKTPVRQRKYFNKKYVEINAKYPEALIISCGYGKRNITALRNINELTALARGSYYAIPDVEVILDIGGQDTKVICQSKGKLKDFFINDKCAAGSGMFLVNAAELLEIEFGDIDLTNVAKPDICLSSVCAVFAQSEIVEMISENLPTETILQAVIWQILIKSKPLIGKVKNSTIILSGGLTQIKGIEKFVENALERKCVLSKYGTYLSSIGCALLGKEL